MSEFKESFPTKSEKSKQLNVSLGGLRDFGDSLEEAAEVEFKRIFQEVMKKADEDLQAALLKHRKAITELLEIEDAGTENTNINTDTIEATRIMAEKNLEDKYKIILEQTVDHLLKSLSAELKIKLLNLLKNNI